MAQVRRHARPSAPSPELVRAQLAAILSSDIFCRSPRLSAFLTFIVEQTLEGQGETLKEQVLAREVYGKDAEFETAADPIVRVDARRLRDRLREYYASAPCQSLLIDVPKGTYAPVFELREHEEPAPMSGTARTAATVATRRWFWVAAAIALVATVSWLVITRLHSTPPVRVVRFTSMPGSEGSPAFSPDGSFVVFSWTGPDYSANGDLWIKPVGGDVLRRLTDTPHVNEITPAWSPDGRQIAYVRYQDAANRGIYLISALGGPERKVTDYGLWPSWSPDSRALVYQNRLDGAMVLVHHVVETGAESQVTIPPPGFSDGFPSVSPDGRTVAFVRFPRNQTASLVGTTKAALFVVPVSGGDPVQVDDWVRGAMNPRWSPDGRDLFYSRRDASGMRVVRVPASGGRPVTAEGLSPGVFSFAISGFNSDRTFRVAFAAPESDVGVRMTDLASSSGGRISGWVPFCDSTQVDWPGRFSRDGRKVSITSDRNGLPQVLVANRDGSDLRTLTTFQGGSVGLAAWSPDGRFVVVDAIDDDNLPDLYVVSTEGGPPKRLTHDERRETTPEWSSDGRWIYYTSDVSNRPEIWRIPAGGGRPAQMTTQGGMDPRESSDGRSLYFLEPPAKTLLWDPSNVRRVAVSGGTVSTVVSGIRPGRWDLTDAGILYMTGSASLAPDPAAPDALEFYDFTSGRVTRIGELPFAVIGFGFSPPRVLAGSRDGRWAVVSHVDYWARDILIAENVR
ncbi:MAG TPA: hypothetical protein VH458_01825 [Vicinamibacterales bacterium]